MEEPNHRGGRGKTHVSTDVLRGMYLSQKLTIREIADRVGLHRGTIISRLRAAQVPMRRRGRRSSYAIEQTE